jgi:hypothetical protein
MIYHQSVLHIHSACDSVNKVLLALIGDVFQGALLGLGYEQSREDTSQHEQRENFEDVVDELVTF